MLAPLSTHFNIYPTLLGDPTEGACSYEAFQVDPNMDVRKQNLEALSAFQKCKETTDKRLWYYDVALYSFLMLFQILWMGVIMFSPLRQLTRRLGFVVLGVLTLIGLSEISKLNLHQWLQPPKVSDSSVR
jgi:hypothetical protein